MTSLRKFSVPAAMAACLMLYASPAQALDVTVTKPPELGWDLLRGALSDGRLDAGDLSGVAFDAFWAAAGNTISQTNLCREAYAESGARPNTGPPAYQAFTFYISATVAGGGSNLTYAQPIRVVPQPDGSLVVGVAKGDGGYARIFRCGSRFAPPEELGPDAADLFDDGEGGGGDGSGEGIVPISDGGVDSYPFDTAHGRVIIHLPDDMRAGDTISGTVYVEPNGRDDSERRANADTLSGYGVDVGGAHVRVGQGVFRFAIAAAGGELVALALRDGGGRVLGGASIPPAQGGAAAAAQNIPSLMQAGRPARITGAFDGDLANTQVSLGGQPSPILAESPRQSVFMSPDTPTGPVTVSVRDGARSFEGVTNNVAVSLNAERTTLARGERTRVTLQVAGLQGVQAPVGVALSATPSVNLQGGNQQTITIAPRDVNAAGEVSRRFNLRVVAAGPFDVTARLNDPACTDPIESAAEQRYRLARQNVNSAEQRRADARRALDETERALENAESDYGEADASRRVAIRDGDRAGAQAGQEAMDRAWQAVEAARRLRNQRQYQLEQARREEAEALGQAREAGEGISASDREAIGAQERARAEQQRCAGLGR